MQIVRKLDINKLVILGFTILLVFNVSSKGSIQIIGNPLLDQSSNETTSSDTSNEVSTFTVTSTETAPQDEAPSSPLPFGSFIVNIMTIIGLSLVLRNRLVIKH